MLHHFKFFRLFLFTLLICTCATEPSGTEITGGSRWEYDDGEGSLKVSVKPGTTRAGRPTISEIVVAYLLFQDALIATSIESGTTVVFPDTLTLTIPSGCTATLTRTADYVVYKLYFYSLSCGRPEMDTVTANGTATAYRGNESRPLNASGSGSSSSASLTYHTVFVTSVAYSANMGGLSGADANCAARAAVGSLTAGLTGTWRAILSDATTSASVRLSLGNVPIKNTNGNTVASSRTDLWDGSLNSAIHYSESGGSVVASVWTGTAADGTKLGGPCSSWTATGGSLPVGNSDAVDYEWITNLDTLIGGCAGTLRLYCINANN